MDQLLNPADPMNVLLAHDLALALSKVGSIAPTEVSPNLLQSWRAEALLGKLCAALWSVFDKDLTLSEQLAALSFLAHALAYLYCGTDARTKFIPSQLFHDIQAMVKNAFFCTAKVGANKHRLG
jgi:hypothetical protein